MTVAEKLRIVKSEWVTNPIWSLFSEELLALEIELGKPIHDSTHPTRIFEYPWVYMNLGPFMPEDVVLDAGPGKTALQFLISKRVKEVHGLDLDKKSVEWVDDVCREKHYDNVFPMYADILKAPYPDNHFDKIVCISVLEHIKRDKVKYAMDELVRMVKPSGKIVVTMDVALNQTGNQVTMDDFMQIMGGQVREPNDRVSVFNIDGIHFSVVCMLIGKE